MAAWGRDATANPGVLNEGPEVARRKAAIGKPVRACYMMEFVRLLSEF